MPTYIARRPQNFQGVALTTGDEVPERVLTNTEPDSWVASGHLLKLNGNQVRALKTAREKRTAAWEAFAEADAAYTAKLADLEKKAAGP